MPFSGWSKGGKRVKFGHRLQLRRALAISRKDIESYYGKPPLLTWGLLFPGVLILALYAREPATYGEIAPGVIAMTLLFGSTSMAAIVITFEKRSGTFQRLLLAPLSLTTILFGKTLSATAYGMATALVLTWGLQLGLGLQLQHLGYFSLGLLLGGLIFSLLGLLAATLVQEVFEAMTLMNFFRFPFLFLSGIITPLSQLPAWLQPLAFMSPLTYVVEVLRYGLTGAGYFASAVFPLGILLLATLGSLLLTAAVFHCRIWR